MQTFLLIIPIWVLMILLYFLYKKAKEQSAFEAEMLLKEAKELEEMGFIGYEGGFILLTQYNEKDAEILLKKWYSEHNSEDFKKQIPTLELMLSELPDIGLTYCLKDVISSAKLHAFSYHTSQIIHLHKDILSRKLNQLLYKDDYGNLVLDDWHNEITFFYKNVLEKNTDYIKSIKTYVEPFFLDKYTRFSESVAPNADKNELKEIFIRLVNESFDYFCFSVVSKELDAIIGNSENNEYFLANPINLNDTSPIEYEKYCKEQLINTGWKASVSKNGADQGVDILASKDNFTLVVQCKKYSNPVGNKAVQEVISGREYYKADAAIVVTNSTYTKSARKLAAASNVKLLHHSELNQVTIDNFECSV
ncbi:MAG: restriction endonuclease [Methylococcales bacterium]|nr:restriction endonuclease [Methylococcales bacterium]